VLLGAVVGQGSNVLMVRVRPHRSVAGAVGVVSRTITRSTTRNCLD